MRNFWSLLLVVVCLTALGDAKPKKIAIAKTTIKATPAKKSTTTSSSLPSSSPKAVQFAPAAIVYTQDGTCGAQATVPGTTCIPSYGLCCSQYGYCGNSTAHCQSGTCQSSYSYTTSSCSTAQPVTQDGTCGAAATVPNSICSAQYGGCCSSHGYCGTTAAHCSTSSGCQATYSLANSCTAGGPVYSQDGSCGPQATVPNSVCPGTLQCCSQYGYCGTTTAHCGTGCQPSFSFSASTSCAASGPVYSTDGTCGAGASIPGSSCPASIGTCCSSHGFCGNSTAHCATGCQTAYSLGGSCVAGGPAYSQDGSCGPNGSIPGSVCPASLGVCCSSYGYCGNSTAFCGTGCISGSCIASSTTTTTATPTPTPVYSQDGSCGSQGTIPDSVCPASLGQCCSMQSYCGSTQAFCGVGCQSGNCTYGATPPIYTPPPGPGRFQIVGQSGVPAMHLAVLPDGKVVFLDKVENYTQVRLPNGQYAYSSVYDTTSNTYVPLSYKTNAFCSSGSFLPNGTLLSFGGNGPLTFIDNTVEDGFDAIRIYKGPGNGDWAEYSNVKMVSKRWYPTTVTLSNGSLFTIGGSLTGVELNNPADNNPTWEIYPFPSSNHIGVYMKFLDDQMPFQLYPHVHVLRSGNLFIFAQTSGIVFNHKTNTVVATLPDTPTPFRRTYPTSGTTVMLPLESSNNFTVRIMICGGGYAQNIYSPSTNSCAIINPEAANPQWVSDDMPQARVMGEGVNLADGKILIINGCAKGSQGFELGAYPVLSPDLYDPKAAAGQRWTTLNVSTIPRIYHSVASLLHDGTVLVTGSNPHEQPALTGQYVTDFRVEIFTPPYLLTGKPRPTLSTVPSTVQVNTSFNITGTFDSSKSISFGLVHTGFATHSLHMSQRYISLTQTTIQGTKITVQAPPDSNVAPPGPYMLFLINDGVPSIAKNVLVS